MKARLDRWAGPGLVALALAALLASVVRWRGQPWADVKPCTQGGAVYRGVAERLLPAGGFVWREPADETTGWRYDLFTPPPVAYDAASGKFVILAAKPTTGDATAGGEWTLVAVKPELFRLQLAGYVGGPGDYRATLVTPHGYDTWLARPGQRFAELGLVLKSVTVATEREAAGVGEVVARAVLWDERAGAEVELDTRSPRLAGTWLAEMRPTDARLKPRVLRVGDSLMTHAGVYRVTNIRLHPPEVVLAGNPPTAPLVLRAPEAPGLGRRPTATQAAQTP